MTSLGWIRRGSLLLVAALAIGSCERKAPPAPSVATWVAALTQPAFDPDGPPEPVRWSLERLLSRGLVELDSTGAVRPACAERYEFGTDSLSLTFHLRADLRFTDGTRVTSADFRDALQGGLARSDHGTRAWLLMALQGIERVRAGKPLPALGIETPDERTLVLRLARPDSLLPRRLALPGVATPWRVRAGTDWAHAIGTGPYRIAAADGVRALTLVRADSLSSARASTDSLFVRFVVGAPRVRALLRSGHVDLVWPTPPALLTQPLPAGYADLRREAFPPRRLLMLMRADMPPTTRLEARHALSHATDRRELLEALGPSGTALEGWLPGGGAFEYPSFDEGEVRQWLARGHLGASFHVVLAYDADRSGAEIARALQGEWARLGLYAELRTLRGAEAAAQPLASAAAHVQLVESQALLGGAEAEVAALVSPMRGGPVGAYRSGWRTREFDPWIAVPQPATPLDAVAAQSRLTEERLALPLAGLPWQWVKRVGGGIGRFHPRFGPEFSTDRP